MSYVVCTQPVRTWERRGQGMGERLRGRWLPSETSADDRGFKSRAERGEHCALIYFSVEIDSNDGHVLKFTTALVGSRYDFHGGACAEVYDGPGWL